VARGLQQLKSGNRRLRNGGLSAALVALHAESGEVLAYVGGDPASSTDRFDRVRNGRRQPGSAVKPFVLLEALEDCGDQRPLTLSTRVADRPLTIDLPSGAWEPENHDREYKGNINVRIAMAESRNVPLVRIARRCGMEAVADRFRKAGLPVPEPAPPSFVLGSVETTPLELARAYTVLATPGRRLEPLPIRRIEQPGGGPLVDMRRQSSRVVRPASAWLVRNTLRTAVESGTARTGALGDLPVAAKTGSSSGLRDAWFAGSAGPVVTVVWVGRDGNEPLGVSGSRAAGPIWRSFMEAAVAAYPWKDQEPPANIVKRFVDRQTGLLVRERNPRAVPEYFRRSVLPPRDRFFRRDRPVPTVR
jgi:membrane carboxypeptidase/penicillin-binding protein